MRYSLLAEVRHVGRFQIDFFCRSGTQSQVLSIHAGDPAGDTGDSVDWPTAEP
jgi:hypothetical protein